VFQSSSQWVPKCLEWISKSSSTGAQYVTLDNKIKCLSLAVLFLATPPVTGTAYIWGLLIANHLDQSLWSTNPKYWAAVRSKFLYSFLEVHNCVAPFTSHGKLHGFGANKSISWAKQAHFHFFAKTFTIWSHLLSTVGDAFRNLHLEVSKVWERFLFFGWANERITWEDTSHLWGGLNPPWNCSLEQKCPARTRL
jgi:hypothetical protein